MNTQEQLRSLMAGAPPARTPLDGLQLVREKYDQLAGTVRRIDAEAVSWLVGERGEDPGIAGMMKTLRSDAGELTKARYLLDQSSPLIAMIDSVNEDIHQLTLGLRIDGPRDALSVTRSLRDAMNRIDMRVDATEDMERQRASDKLHGEVFQLAERLSNRLTTLETEREQRESQRKATSTLRSAYVLWHYAVNHLTDTVDDPRPTKRKAYQYLKTSLDTFIDREQLEIPESYELPSSYESFRKQITRAKSIPWDTLNE